MFPPPTPRADPDASIRQTDTDAAGARLSAAQKGYIHDPHVKHFVPRAHLQPARPPLINIGTYLRFTAIDELVGQWLNLSRMKGTQCQIVSMGAGSDTRFWRIATGPYQEALASYIEIDFPEVTTKKAMAIRKNKDLSAAFGDPASVTLGQGGTSLHSPRYHLIPSDLRQSPVEGFGQILSSPSPTSSNALLSPALPTLVLFECVLAYMSPAASSAILEWFVNYFSEQASKDPDSEAILGGVVYEMFQLGDAFGKIMVNNLKSRNVILPGAEPYHNAQTLPGRFTNHGFTAARAMTLREIQRDCIPEEELERIAKLELLDEVEEMNLLLDHYALTWGLFLSKPEKDEDWGGWGLKKVGGR
ncbi:hypothetical protein AX16_006241 [Volvariella volvacea WC 439]|nr:hypothetical protein AX16_006241 [Volvariella volvacea WC 439]